MPFINAKLAANQEQLARENYEKQRSRTSRFHFEPDKVMALLRTRIVGQDAVLASMEDMLYRLKADFEAESRSLSVNLFLGPTGVGKTETVRVLAESILGGADKLCRIDMNTLTQEHYAAALTVAPPGYVGSKEVQAFNESYRSGWRWWLKQKCILNNQWKTYGGVHDGLYYIS